jgi:RNA polymerase sigma-70 factor (ECF subfamily)
MAVGAGDVTLLLKSWSEGDSAAQERLFPLVYKELRRLARRYRRKSSIGDTLQTTALVNEAYLRLVDIHNVDWRDRVHFFAVSAQVMRRILVDWARSRGAIKRGGQTQWVDEEAAEVLGLSPQSVRRDWSLAKAWLLRELSRDMSGGKPSYASNQP